MGPGWLSSSVTDYDLLNSRLGLPLPAKRWVYRGLQACATGPEKKNVFKDQPDGGRKNCCENEKTMSSIYTLTYQIQEPQRP